MSLPKTFSEMTFFGSITSECVAVSRKLARLMASLDKESFYIELGKKIRAVREKRKLTQEALASLLSITRTSVTNIEKGRQKIFLHTFLEIAQVLDVSPDVLVPSIRYSGSLEDVLKEKLTQKELSWVQETINEIGRS